ncbi:MAG: DNA repair protein RadA [Chloroflexi bacterium]|nr:DNA repair protein RadA [Chloroflexota bacterium]
MPPKKARTVFVCQQCGYQAPRWAGQCPDCGEWNTLVEQVQESRRTAQAGSTAGLRSHPQRLREVNVDAFQRWRVPMEEFNRVLGGGIVPGSLVLIGGDPGIGKSTLLLQVAAQMADAVGPVLYVSGEESAQQIKLRAERLGINPANLYLLAETNLDVIIQELDTLQPKAVIIDSIQTVFLEELVSSAGSVTQVRECASRMQHVAKAAGTPIFLVGHVTKAGAIAGPRVLEHIVDVVLYLEGDRFHSFRLLRSTKNRFGATNEVGVFAMEQGGMVEVLNPSEAFLADRVGNFAGSAIAVTMEGSRPILCEIQALTSTTSFALPRRTGNGVDMNRLLLMVAVLSKRLGMNLSNQDVFVNVVGGLKVSEPATDLSLAIAIASSFRDTPVPVDLAIMGEVGLSGELRSVSQAERRLGEAAKLGYARCIVPHTLLKRVDAPRQIEMVGARNLGEALDAALRR